MEIKYQIFENENLFVQKFRGDFSVENYMKYSQYITAHVMSKPIKKVLIDFRGLKFGNLTDRVPDDYQVNFDKVKKIRININKNVLKSKDVTLAFWVDDPLPALTAHFFISSFSKKNYHYCFTADDIIKTLKLPEHMHNLESIINNLENTFKDSLKK